MICLALAVAKSGNPCQNLHMFQTRKISDTPAISTLFSGKITINIREAAVIITDTKAVVNVL